MDQPPKKSRLEIAIEKARQIDNAAGEKWGDEPALVALASEFLKMVVPEEKTPRDMTAAPRGNHEAQVFATEKTYPAIRFEIEPAGIGSGRITYHAGGMMQTTDLEPGHRYTFLVKPVEIEKIGDAALLTLDVRIFKLMPVRCPTCHQDLIPTPEGAFPTHDPRGGDTTCPQSGKSVPAKTYPFQEYQRGSR